MSSQGVHEHMINVHYYYYTLHHQQYLYAWCMPAAQFLVLIQTHRSDVLFEFVHNKGCVMLCAFNDFMCCSNFAIDR